MSSSQTDPLCLVRGSINIDETFSVPHIVRPGETLSSSGLVSRPGGKGANQAAALGLAGAPVYMAGAVGSDAPWPMEELRKRGVDVSGVRVLEDTPTGRAFIQIAADGENSIVLLKGANFAEDPSSDDPSVVFSSAPRRITHLMLQNEIPLSTTRAFLSYGGSHGVLSAWNPSPMPSTSELREMDWPALGVLIVNEGEGFDLLAALAPELAGDAQEKSEEELQARAGELLDKLEMLKELKEMKWIVVTRGAKGVLARVRTDDGGERQTFDMPAAKPKQVKDTTGAGDTFAGNLLAALMRTLPDPSTHPSRAQAEEILRWAGQAAAMAVETEGAMGSIPAGEDVQKRLDGK